MMSGFQQAPDLWFDLCNAIALLSADRKIVHPSIHAKGAVHGRQGYDHCFLVILCPGLDHSRTKNTYHQKFCAIDGDVLTDGFTDIPSEQDFGRACSEHSNLSAFIVVQVTDVAAMINLKGFYFDHLT